MSEVKKISPVGNIYGWEEGQFGEFVLSEDYDALAAEPQALREEVEKAQNALAFTEQWHGVRYERLWHWAHAELDEEQKRRYFNIVANGTAEHSEPPTYAQQLCRMKHRYECAEKEAAALRARVAVVPDRLPRSSDIAAIHQHSIGWNACLDELARINGMTVSESALDTLRKAASGEVKHLNNGLCPDDIEGHEARDPDCPVCRALLDTES
ncbi:hypothetical protein [Pseudomonas aeruginosa]|uniref:hypothetical protein n=1 Tax=Pseudomonas aeruginosa TaxID=287 RepID=UPI0022382788|nr:hypothetical protein [Pseudomonas aeruginosa]MCW4650993.1 hypothetical protein [Pseudomonas aeruginosa]